jgi:hypothetical protein
VRALCLRKSPHPAFGHLLPRVPRGRRETREEFLAYPK